MLLGSTLISGNRKSMQLVSSPQSQSVQQKTHPYVTTDADAWILGSATNRRGCLWSYTGDDLSSINRVLLSMLENTAETMYLCLCD